MDADSALCRLVHSVYGADWTFKFLFLLQFVLCSLSVVCVLSLALLLGTWRAFGENIRILLISTLIGFGLGNVGILLSCIYQLQALIFRSAESQCYFFSFNFRDCFVINEMFNISICGVYAGAFALALERLIGSLLEPRLGIRKWISFGLVCIQWSFALGGNLRGWSDERWTETLSYAHCSAHLGTPTQSRPLFFFLLAMMIFSLAIYSTLCCHYSSSLVLAELKRFNKTLYENVISTETTFPLTMMICLLWVGSVVLDKNFQLAFWNFLFGDSDRPLSRDLVAIGQWTEIQKCLLPLFSLAFFGLLIRKAWPTNPTKLYGQIVSDFAQNLETIYESRNADALSFHSAEGTLRCDRDVALKCTQICERRSAAVADSPTVSTISSSSSSSRPPN